MIGKRETRTLLLASLLIGISLLTACMQPADLQSDTRESDQSSGEVPTWTPRAADLTQTALPTRTMHIPVSEAESATPMATDTPLPSKTPMRVTFSVSGGNLNVRRGPSLAYNYVGVLNDKESANVVGRDRISRFVMIEMPGDPNTRGWVTTETQYSSVDGDISSLPFVQVEPAKPAFIRNCTYHTLMIYPEGIQLLPKTEKPYNEERLDVRTYQVYDLENPENKPIEMITLSEGRTVDIKVDWSGEKSKCE